VPEGLITDRVFSCPHGANHMGHQLDSLILKLILALACSCGASGRSLLAPSNRRSVNWGWRFHLRGEHRELSYFAISLGLWWSHPKNKRVRNGKRIQTIAGTEIDIETST
jgi:hypothetical protein